MGEQDRYEGGYLAAIRSMCKKIRLARICKVTIIVIWTNVFDISPIVWYKVGRGYRNSQSATLEEQLLVSLDQ